MDNFVTTLNHDQIEILDKCPDLPVFPDYSKTLSENEDNQYEFEQSLSAVIEWNVVQDFRSWGIKSFNAVIYKVTLSWVDGELVIEDAEVDINDSVIPRQPLGLTYYAGKWEVEWNG